VSSTEFAATAVTIDGWLQINQNLQRAAVFMPKFSRVKFGLQRPPAWHGCATYNPNKKINQKD